jgi:CHAT domain-containing protein
MKSVSLRLVFPLFVIVLAASGCGKKHPAWYEGIYDLSQVPISRDLAPALAAGLATLDQPVPTGKGVDDVHLYGRFIERIVPPETRQQAGDELYVKWQLEPGNLLWMELTLNYNYLLHRDADLDRMWALPALSDTNTTAGLFLEAWVQYGRGDRGRLYRKAELGIAELDSVGQVWLNVKLATVEHHTGHTIDAVRRIVKWLPVARRVGGPSYEARLWLIIANRLALVDRQDDALSAAALSVVLARRANSRFAELAATIVVGEIMGRRQEIQPAIAKLLATADAADHEHFYWLVQRSLDRAAEILVTNGDYGRALAIDRRQLALTYAMDDSLNAPRNMVSIAHSFRMAGQLDSCFAYLTRAEHIVKGFSDKRNLPRMAEALAEYYCLVGNYAVAESLIMEAKGLSSIAGTEIHEARLLVDLLPQALELGRVDWAYAWLGRLDELEPTLYSRGLDQNLHADYKLLSADLLSRQGEFQLAAEALGQVQKEVEAGGGEDRRWKYLSSAGDLALLREDFATAEKCFAEALALARQGTDPDKIASSHFRLGHLYLESGRLPEARALFASDESDQAFGPRYRTRLVSQLLLGITHAREGHPKQALDVLQQGMNQFNPAAVPDLALRFSLAKGQALAATGQIRQAEATLREVLASSAGLSSEISFEELNIHGSSVGREAAGALIALYFDHPELLPAGKVGSETLRLTGIIGAELPLPGRGAPWLAYRMGDERSWLWVINEDGPALQALPGQEELRRLLKPVLADMILAGRPVDREAATHLTEVLLGPVLASWPQGQPLTLVPDGLLHDLPWSALPLPASAADGDTRLVIDWGPVLEYGGTLQPKARRQEPGELSLLAIGCNSASGPEPDTAGKGLPRLRRAEQEAGLVYSHWPNASKQLRTGAAAAWDAVAGSGQQKYGVIHLASHAEVFQGLPQRSTLRLSMGETAVPVTIPAVSSLDLDAELVYLSCCNAARRLSTSGSGVSDFAGAFLAAGARTVIASTLWVDDEASAYLAERFYRHWLAGLSRAEALRAAQQDLRAAREVWDHPSYWAFFRLIGEGG